MKVFGGARIALLCVSVELTACGGPEIGRIGAAAPLGSGEPRTECEREGWYEVAPARVVAQGMTAGIGYNVVHSQVVEGDAIFHPGEHDPEDLDDVWPALREPALQRKHEARIAPVDDASSQSLYWALGGVGGLAVGIGTAAAIQKQSPTGAAVAGVSGLVIGLVGVIAAIAVQPSGEAQVYADARRRLFIRDEDDPEAVLRGVDRANETLRRECARPDH